MSDLFFPPEVPAGHGSAAFSLEEYAARLSAVQKRLVERGWSALVVVDPANLFYLCGYNAWSFYVPQCLVVPAEGAPHLFARSMDAQGAHWTAALPQDQVHGYPEQLVHRPDAHPFDWITRRAVEIGVLPDRPDTVVAAEMDAHFFSPRAYLSLAGALAHATVVDSAELVNWVRLVKSPAEIESLRIAGTIATGVMEVALDGIREGRRQCDVVAEIQQAQALGSGVLGGDYPAVVPMLPTGESAGTPHLTWSDAALIAGEATTIELAGVFRRYHAPLARTVVLGRPEPRLASCADAVADGMLASLDELRPGRTAADCHRAFAGVIARHGLTKESRIGYSIGIGYPPDWGERTVSLREGATTVLEAGMAFHVILGMWMDGWGYETSESVVITDAGAENLTHVPQGLTIKTKQGAT
ncbi:M24 family metallopeptidase [Aeromicrobium sp.]|uniref:M24 family metallopeptidase n=1 Tax=Aeromicrobium sp. TaxID=1871063 RepID=UPI003D6BA09A